MAHVIERDEDGSALFDDDEDPWPDEKTAVIPAEELELLRDVMDGDERPTARFAPVHDDPLAIGSDTELPQLPAVPVCEQVSSSPRAMERSVTVAPAAERHRAWLLAVGLALFAVEILALAW